MALEINKHAAVKFIVTWGISGLVAFVVGLFIIHIHNEADKRPCQTKGCFILLDKRIAVIEADMKARTADRYTGADAKRDKEAAQKELSLMRKELNQRIDAMHRVKP
jgi:hypothetical protein